MADTPSVGTGYLRIAGDFSGLNAQLVGLTSASRWGKYGKAMGGALAAGVAAIGVAKIAYDIGGAFDDAFDTIETRTGKSGKGLERLKDSFKDVLTSVPTDFDTAAEAVAGLNQRLNITGKPLTRLSKQFAALSKITGENVGENVAAVSRAFGDWEVKTGRQGEQLDRFFRASQASGASVSDLAQEVVQFGAPLRQVGFSLDEATAMFAQFEEAGVNTQTMMPGLRFALRSFMEEGLDPTKELSKTFEGIASGAIDTTRAFEIFGGRATPDMIEAIAQGRFELDELTKAIKQGDQGVLDAEKSTRDAAEWLQILGNRVKVFVEPVVSKFFEVLGKGSRDLTKFLRSSDFKEFGADIQEALRDIRPVLDFVGGIASDMFSGFRQTFGGVVRVVKGFTEILGGIFQGDWSKVWDGAKTVVSGAVEALKGTIRTLTAPFRAVFGAIKDVAVKAFDKVLGALTTVLDGVAAGADAMSKLPGPIGDAWDKVQTGAEDASDSINGFRESLRGFNRLDKDAKQSARGISHSLDGVRASLAQSGRDFDKTADKGGKDMDRLRRDSDSHSRKMARDVAGNVGRMVDASGKGFERLRDNANKALKGFGAKPVNFALVDGKKIGTSGLAKGGFAGVLPGYSKTDDRLIGVRGGEAVLRPEDHVPMVDASLRLTHGMGLKDMFRRTGAKMSGFASGGFVPVPGFPGEDIARAALAGWQSLQKRFKLFLTDAYDADGSAGHASAAHNAPTPASGQAVDVTPGAGGSWADVGRAVAWAVRAGWTPTYYDGSGGSIDLPPHGPGHHAHITIPFGAAGGAVLEKLKRVILKGPKGPLRSMGQGALDKTWRAANARIRDAMMADAAHGPISGISADGQVERVFAQIAKRLSASRIATLALGMAGYAESGMRDLPGGHSTSQGALQLLASTASGMGINPHDEGQIASAFLLRGFYGRGGANKLAASGLPAHLVAQGVQGSAFSSGSNYLAQKGAAQAWMQRFGLQKGGMVLPFAGSFNGGGTVPGPVGKPQAAIVHGGEKVTPSGHDRPLRLRGRMRMENWEEGIALFEGIAEDAVDDRERFHEKDRKAGMR